MTINSLMSNTKKLFVYYRPDRTIRISTSSYIEDVLPTSKVTTIHVSSTDEMYALVDILRAAGLDVEVEYPPTLYLL